MPENNESVNSNDLKKSHRRGVDLADYNRPRRRYWVKARPRLSPQEFGSPLASRAFVLQTRQGSGDSTNLAWTLNHAGQLQARRILEQSESEYALTVEECGKPQR